jgi:transcriptional regulator with XRE-family HTH domain
MDELRFYEQVKLARERMGMSQRELADNCRLSRATVSGIERQIGNPTLATMQLIAHSLGMQLKIELI